MTIIPKHLGVILDGNRRWAEERGLPAIMGHRRGAKKSDELIKWAKERGIKTLTLFVFSTENWKRPKREVDFLMGLVKKKINSNLAKINQEKIRIKIIGQKEKLDKNLQESIERAEEATKNNQAINVNFALSYGGRAEIVEAIKNIIKTKVAPEKIDEKTVSQNLWTSDLDLLIRTGKEQRISNFLIWQAAYSELYFCPKYWPDFCEHDLDEALDSYSRRQRRLGS